MSMKNSVSPKDNDANVSVTVNVDVPKIVKYSCLTGIMIVGIIFGAKCFRKVLEEGYLDKLTDKCS